MKHGDTQDWSESLYFQCAKDALVRARQASSGARNGGSEFDCMKAVATVIVFSALCLEAFINQVYFKNDKPTGSLNKNKKWHEFTHEDKWFRLPVGLNSSNETFDKSKEPFLTFKQLIKFRNERIVHFHPQTEGSDTLCPGLIPWAEEISNLALAEKYFDCVTDMVELLHHLTGGNTPRARLSIHQEYVRSVTLTFGSKQRI